VTGVTFSDSDSAPVQNFLIRDRIRDRLFLKFENRTPIETPATIIDPTVIYTCFSLSNNRTDSCYCRNGRVTPDLGPVFHKFLTPGLDSGPKGKHKILPESTPVNRIRSHLWFAISKPPHEPVLLRSKLATVLIQSDSVLIRAHLCRVVSEIQEEELKCGVLVISTQ